MKAIKSIYEVTKRKTKTDNGTPTKVGSRLSKAPGSATMNGSARKKVQRDLSTNEAATLNGMLAYDSRRTTPVKQEAGADDEQKPKKPWVSPRKNARKNCQTLAGIGDEELSDEDSQPNDAEYGPGKGMLGREVAEDDHAY